MSVPFQKAFSQALASKAAWDILAVNIPIAFTGHKILVLTFFVLTTLDLVSIITLAFVSLISKLHKDYLSLNPCSLSLDTRGIYSILQRARLPTDLNYTQQMNSWPFCNIGKTQQPSRDFTQTPALSSECSALQGALFLLQSHSRTPQGHCEKTTVFSCITFRVSSAQAMRAPQRLDSQIHRNQMRIWVKPLVNKSFR